MKIGPSSGKPHPAVVAEASAWFIEFRAGDVNDEARQHFIEWLRRSPEHIQAYLEVYGVWAELPTSDPEGKIDIASLIARARSEADVVVSLSPGNPLSPQTSSSAESRMLRQRPRRAVLAIASLALLAFVAVRFWGIVDFGGAYST